MTEPDLPESDKPARKWVVIAGSAALLLGALVLAFWVARPEPRSVVVYEVSGEAARATVVYSTFAEDGEAVREVELTSFPWHAELTVVGEVRDGVLTVTIGPEGGSVGCKVSVDGVERRAATASGAFTSAFCSGF
ncbi:MmpS family transport accessory protein [Saccharothrix sp.]|uniref:MmpS family transport accessory protein n=1 Tax=Saccharothrix sp. TaxID=1873460 RepID=UPI0028120726|nr:MmpS family transport accessory protein [Saccharothrix sp.]